MQTTPTSTESPAASTEAAPIAPSSTRGFFSTNSLLWPALLCIAVFLSLLGATVALWHHELEQVRADIRSYTKLACDQTIPRIDAVMEEHLRPLRKLEDDTSALGETALLQFRHDAERLIESREWLRLAAWINPSDYCRESVTRPGVNGPGRRRMSKDPAAFPRLYAGVRKARESGGETIAVYTDADGEAEAVFVVPVQSTAGRPGGGVILYDIALVKLLQPMFDEQSVQSFAVTIDNGEARPICQFGELSGDPGLASSRYLRVADQRWRLTVQPTPAFVATRETRSPMGLMIGGAVIALITSAGLWQGMLHRRRDRRVTETHLAALTALNDISLAISENPEATSTVFESLIRTACDVLGMSSGSITLLDPVDQTMHVLHRHNLAIEPDRKVYRLDELPMCKQCMETHDLLFAQDVWKYPGPFNADRYKSFNIRSIVVVPFLAKGKPLGAMVLSDSKAKKFTNAQRHMAKLWGAQAAVTLSNQRLYKGMNRALTAQEALFEKVQSLYHINTKIQTAGTLKELFQLIANLTPETLGFDCTIICLQDSEPGFVQVGGATAGTSAEQFVGSRMPCCIHCTNVIDTRKPLVIESASGDPILRETVLASWGSAMFMPLVTSTTAPIGLLILMRKESIPATPEEIQIAQLFAARAAVVIENTRLYEQTRTDADAKAMLLRELNHRVKNNLAAIVGLLSTKPRDLSPEAQLWIDRATQRIATMARTHDLFSGGLSEVSVQELASKAIDSVNAIKPPGVRIRTDLDDIKVQLSTDRAVTLAMVLYELCCNALVHGMGESGQLVLRGRNIDDQRIAIDIIDSGSPTGVLAAGKAIVHEDRAAAGQINGNHKGMGLSLVEGLVGRELHGQFKLRLNPSGGSTATVEFPINGKAPPRV